MIHLTAAIPIVIVDQPRDWIGSLVPGAVGALLGAAAAFAGGWWMQKRLTAQNAENAKALAILQVRIQWWEKLRETHDEARSLIADGAIFQPQKLVDNCTSLTDRMTFLGSRFPDRETLNDGIKKATTALTQLAISMDSIDQAEPKTNTDDSPQLTARELDIWSLAKEASTTLASVMYEIDALWEHLTGLPPGTDA